MAKKAAKKATSPKVRAFCQRFSAGLRREYWGDIDPDLFRAIADDDSPEDMGEEFAGWRDSLAALLAEALDGD